MKIRRNTHKLAVWLFMFMSIFLFTACQGEENSVLPEKEKPPVEKKEEFETFSSHDGSFTITATTKWQKEDTLYPEAVLSLVSEEYNSYLIALQEKKEEFPIDMELSQYTDLISQSLKKDLSGGEISAMEDMDMGGEKGKFFQVKGTKEETPLVYEFLIIEKEDSFYQVMLWSSQENMEKNQAYYDEIIKSFQFEEVSTPS